MRPTEPRNICVVSYPVSPLIRGWIPLGKLLDALQPLYDKIYLVTGNLPAGKINHTNVALCGNFSMEVARRRHLPMAISAPLWLANFVKGQLLLSYHLCRNAHHSNTILFFLGSVPSLVPLLLAKIMRKQVVTVVIDYLPASQGAAYGNWARRLYSLLTGLNYRISDRLLVETETTIPWCHLERHADKVRVGAQLPVDTERFRVITPFESRDAYIGYLGRLSAEKGVLQLLEALPSLCQRWPKVKFVLGGDGVLREQVMRLMEAEGLGDRVELAGWVPFDELPSFFNRMSFMIHPSFTETGVPLSILEAMSCGTPVIVTDVGGVRDAVKDGITGFVVTGNSPTELAAGVERALTHRDLLSVSREARRIVAQEFSLSASRERYRAMLMNDPC